ncbi:MAG: methionine ABC transporter ATP-binding protein [Acholeplasmatales bacterium]|jgi:D-methionine transport system ATP-binding protein|nr:methionine ABC transporter ATP-binding protein [Acholeplasmatales bacterium]
MIQIIDVCKEYLETNKSVFVALKNINLEINERESIGIVGQSGAGKSTLIRIINGLITKTSGKVIIDGKDIDTLKQKEINLLRHDIGMVFQNFNLINQLTVYDNIKLALEITKYPKDKVKPTILKVLEDVGLSAKIKAYPSTLSGGEKQRVGIARAIVNKPKYLLLDEITSSLDFQSAKEIITLLKKLQSEYNSSIIFISHQIDVVKELCNRFILIENKEIVEDISTLELFTNPKSKQAIKLVDSVIDSNISVKNSYRLTFIDSTTNEPIISDISKKFEDIQINILFARTIYISNHEIGYLDLVLNGKNQESVVKYLEEKGIRVRKNEYIN